MSAAALALAAAVLLAPPGSRGRARPVHTPGARRVPLPVWAAAGCAAAATLLPPAGSVAMVLLAATVVARRRTGQRTQRRAAAGAALHAALDVLVSELRVGAHPVAAIGAAARETDGAVARSLGSVAARAVLGADVAAGLRAEGRRSPAPGHWDRLAVCWNLAQTHGLAIASLMEAAQRDIAERERFRSRVDAGMAGARATAAILAALPLLGILLGHAIGAEPLAFLLSGGSGSWLLLVGTAFVCCGLLWSDRITSQVAT